MHSRSLTLLGACLIFILNNLSAQDSLPSFPGAEGFGSFATGGRGGDVYIVTNLNDHGSGSLREAIEASGPRTVVFAVSGTIELESPLRILNDNITIAGQTAPGDGICLKNYTLFITESENVIVRYITCRLGDDKRWEHDAISGRFANNVIVDHCSFSWSIDETVGNYDNSNLTFQWCIISESLHDSYHSKGAHGMGAFIGGKGISFHHNLLAHHHNRLPRLCGSRYSGEPELEMVDHRNNVIYNWVTNSCYGGEGGRYNIVNNYYKSGPATYNSVKNRIVAPRADDNSDSDAQPVGTWGRFYVEGNYVHGYPDISDDNWNGGVQGVTEEEIQMIKSDTAFECAEVTTQTPTESYNAVLNHAGASYPKRDRVDARVTEETRLGTAKYGRSFPGIIDAPEDVGGYPVLETTTPPTDTDKDGMPDVWEDANGLNKNDAEDGKLIQADGYSNLEHYLNGLVGEFKYLLRPMEVETDVNEMTVSLTWTNLSDDEEGLILERAEGEGDFVQIADLDAGTDSFTDNTITSYGDYYYRIKAYKPGMETCYTDALLVEITDPTEYTVTVNLNGSGSVIMNPDGGAYITGTEVVLLAVPDNNWKFDYWSGDLEGEDNPAVITTNGHLSITANFSNSTGTFTTPEIIREPTIYPVPFKENTCLSFLLSEDQEIEISILDMQGRLVLEVSKGYFPAGKNSVIIGGIKLSEGIYILNIQSDSYLCSKRIVAI